MSGRAGTAGAVESLLPLKPVWFHILLALKAGAAHGYAIRERVEARTAGAVRLWPVTLYGTIRQLLEQGLIEALEGEDDPDDDARRRYYQLTAFGSAVLLAEADRMAALVRAARARPVAEA